MNLSFASLSKWRSGALQAFTRFPGNMLCAMIGAGCGITALHTDKNEWLVGQCIRLAMAAALGMPLFFSLRLLRERVDRLSRWPIEIVGILLLALWVMTQPPRPYEAPSIVVIRWLLLLAALHFFAAVSPFVGHNQPNGFWQFNRRLFLRFALATLYTGVLTAGLELALFSADKLFALKLSKAYGDLWFIMVGLFHPTFFLSGVPGDVNALDADEQYPRGLKAFTQFALAPLVAVYTAILYTYAVKIILVRTWPNGWVALPVLLLAGIGILSFLLLYPLRRRESERWARWYMVNFPRALAPLSLLLLLAVHVRIREYGVTEPRYLGTVLGFWILVWTLVFVTRPNVGIRWIPSSLAAICLLAAFGPWSAGAISKASQLRRLEKMLQAHGLWKDGHAQIANEKIDLSARESTDFRSTLTYLVEMHGGSTVQRIFAPILSNRDWNKAAGYTTAHDAITALHLVTHGNAEQGTFVRRKAETFIGVEGYHRMARVNLYSGRGSKWAPSKVDDIQIGLEDGVLKLALKDEPTPQTVPLENVYAHLDSAEAGQLPDEQMTVDFQHQSRAFRLVFESLMFRREAGDIRITNCEFYLLEK